MGLLQEFKAFAMRGNVVDLAVGVIIGTAFGKIVSSLVADVIMPPIGYLIGGVKFTDLKKALPPVEVAGVKLEPAVIEYGKFLQATFDFLIVAFCVFLMIKAMNMLIKKKEEAPKPAELSTQEKLLVEIRDLLKATPKA
ncbi:MAG TPA: large-conductance mechanosensitive channel protein MscL [Pirellulaceae bacterium]|nr:large-conductance mechanosensitive channel protein MscL [Pirellulaceae bacterium]